MIRATLSVNEESMSTNSPVLLADVGGTNARFALLDEHGIGHVEILPGADYPTLSDAARAYLAQIAAPSMPKVALLAVASPIAGEVITMTNRGWSFTRAQLRADLGLERLEVINDFTAVALSLPHLAANEVEKVGGGVPEVGAPMAVLGAGTGLGVSGLMPGANASWTAITGEGGHVTMTSCDDREDAVLRCLRKRFGHVSAERVLSGIGLVYLYEALSEVDGQPPDRLEPRDITARARDRVSPHCNEAIAMFCGMLGTVAGNLSLTLGSRGGCYLAGGVIPALGELFDRDLFRRRFEAKGRFRDYVAAIPTYLVTHKLPAFVGLSSLVRQAL